MADKIVNLALSNNQSPIKSSRKETESIKINLIFSNIEKKKARPGNLKSKAINKGNNQSCSFYFFVAFNLLE